MQGVREGVEQLESILISKKFTSQGNPPKLQRYQDLKTLVRQCSHARFFDGNWPSKKERRETNAERRSQDFTMKNNMRKGAEQF